MPQFECIATLLRSLGSYQPNSPLPYLFNIGDKIFTSIPYHSLMNNERNNTLIGFMQCNSNANYRMHNWAQVLTRECPEAAKHAISFILKEGYKISFIFNDSFEILANNTVYIFDKLYNVTENIINDANIPSFIGFNTTEDCIVNANFETNLRNFTSQALQATIQAGSISNSFIASGEETTDLNTRNCDDTIATASFTSFISETALTFCCLLLSLLG